MSSTVRKSWVVEMFYQGKVHSRETFATREEALEFFNSKASACRLGLVGWSVSYPREVASAPQTLVCGECGEEKDAKAFCDPTSSEPHCKECAKGSWEMMGDDPCGKGWRA